MQEIASQLMLARNLRQISHEQLAEITGLTPEEITQYESGTMDPQASTLLKISKALNYAFQIGDASI